MSSHAPLEPGDPIHMRTIVECPRACDPDDGDIVMIGVPKGRGLALEAWLRRQLCDTPDVQRERREQDHLAELAVGGREVS